MNVRPKKFKPQYFLLIGVVVLAIIMTLINQIPGAPAEQMSLPTNWLELIKPEDLVDLGVVPQEKQTFELAAGKVAQFTLPPNQGVTINPVQSGLRIAHLSLSTGNPKLAGVFKPSQPFTLQPVNEQRLIYVMSEYLTGAKFEAGPATLIIKP